MSNAFHIVLPAALFLVLPAVPAPDPSAPSKTEEAVAHKVLSKLLAEMEAPPGLDWPPLLVLEVGDRPPAGNGVVRTPEGKERPRLTVRVALLRTLKGEEDALAFVLGHELGHLLLGHHRLAPDDAVSDEREYAADVKAAELLLRAGYSLRKATRDLTRHKKEIKSTHASAARKGGPLSWDDRFVRLRDNPALWKSSLAFENGVLLMALEQYEAAESCFTRVVEEFPSSSEGWLNLGIACLMQYCDGVTEERLRDYDVGPLVCGSFYRRGPSIRLRGFDALWWRAVGSLREALRLHPDLPSAKAHLGLAFLLHPGVKDVGEATRYLTEAAEAAAEDNSLDAAARAALLVNLGVARLAAGEKGTGLGKLRAALALGRPTSALVAAINYNRAIVLADAGGDDRREALDLFEKYLRAADPRSAWWPIAYDHYAELCRVLGRAARTKAEFLKAAAERLRRTATVTLPSGQTIAAGEYIEDVRKRFPPRRTVGVLPGTNLKRYLFEPMGVEVLATDEVIAILLRGAKAPPLKVRRGEVVAELRVGTIRRDVERLLDGEDGLVQGGGYVYYRALGIAVRYDGAGPEARAVEIVLAQPPEAGPLSR